MSTIAKPTPRRVLGVLAAAGATVALPPSAEAGCGEYCENDGSGYVFCLYSGSPNRVCEAGAGHCIVYSFPCC